jgi:hypothetical protein
MDVRGPKTDAGEPTQKTVAPNKKERIDIPIPKREDFFRNLKKAAKPLRLRRPNK